MATFFNKEIKNTFQRILQLDNGVVQDGLGNTVTTASYSGSFTGSFSGTLTGTASFAISASHEITHELSSSHAQTADLALTANTASYVSASNIDMPFTSIINDGDITIGKGGPGGRGEIRAISLRVSGSTKTDFHAKGRLNLTLTDSSSKFESPLTSSKDAVVLALRVGGESVAKAGGSSITTAGQISSSGGYFSKGIGWTSNPTTGIFLIEGNESGGGALQLTQPESGGSFDFFPGGNNAADLGKLADIWNTLHINNISASGDIRVGGNISSSVASTGSFGFVSSTTVSATTLVGTGSGIVGIITSSFAQTASFVAQAVTNASNITTNTTNIGNLTSVTGSYAITGSNTFVGNQAITGTLSITSTASAAYVSSSFIGNGALITGVITSSFAQTASFVAQAVTNASNINNLTVLTGSYTTTGSNNFIGTQAISGTLEVTGSVVFRSPAVLNVSSISSSGTNTGVDIRAQRPVLTHTATFSISSSEYIGTYNIVHGTISCSIQTGSLEPGVEFEFFQTSSTGNFNFSTASNVNLVVKNDGVQLAGLGSGATLKYISGDTFHLVGDLS